MSVAEAEPGLEASVEASNTPRTAGALLHAGPPVLLFDGECGFCSRAVRFVLARERGRRDLRFAALRSTVGDAVRERHPWLAGLDTVVWFEARDRAGEDVVLVKSAASLHVAIYLGGVWGVLGRVGGVAPRAALDRMYDVVAKRRQRIAPACGAPRDEERARFID